MTADIRVRLSPEGAAEVFAMLQKLQQEAKAAAVQSVSNAGVVENAFTSLKRLLPTLGFTAVTASIIAMGKSALDNADHVEKMAQIAGTSAENFSTLAFGAKNVDVSSESLQKNLVRLSSTLGALSRGSTEQIDLFREIGLSARDFDGKDTVEAFAIIAKALEKLPDGFKKVDIQRRLFGKGATELQDLLQKVGVEGFDALRLKAEQFGAVISTKTANEAEELKHQLELVEVQSGKLSRSLLADLLPSLNKVLEKFIATKSEMGLIPAAAQAVGNSILVALDKVNALRLLDPLNLLDLKSRLSPKNLDLAGDLGLEKAQQEVARLQLEFDDLKKKSNFLRNAGILDAGRNRSGELAELEVRLETAKRKVESYDKAAEDKRSADKKKADAAAAAEDAAAAADEAALQAKITQSARTGGIDRLNVLTGLEQQRRVEIEKTAQVERAALEAKLAGTGNLLATQQALEAADISSIKRRSDAAQEAFAFDLEIANRKAELSKKGAEQLYTGANLARVLVGVEQQATRDRAAAAQTLYNTKNALLLESYNKEKAAQAALVALDIQAAEFRKRAQQVVNEINDKSLTDEQKAAVAIQRAWETEAQLQDAVLTGNLDKVKQLREELLAMARGVGGEVGKKLAGSAEYYSDLSAAKEKLAQQDNAKAAQDAIAALKPQIEKIKEELSALQVDIKVDVNKESLEALAKSIRERLERETINIALTAIPGSGAPAAPIPGFASGGRAPAGLAMVGERGPELVQFLSPARVYNAKDTREMMAAMSKVVRIPAFASGGIINPVVMAPAAIDRSSVENMGSLNLSIGGKPVGSIQSDRAVLRRLGHAVNAVKRGT